jgi:hypothetical protein
MKNRVGALVMIGLLALYLVLVTQYAVLFIEQPSGISKAIGIALAVMPAIGVWIIVSELVFAVRADRLIARLASAGELPVDDLPKLPSGRPDPKAADEEFPKYQEAVERNPIDWKAWFRLGLAYEASGDRRRARWATRRAIRLERGRNPE